MPKNLLLASLLLTFAVAAPAQASGLDVIRDCTDDEVLTKTYTQKEYREALAKLPADADQYGNCRDIIARAQDRAAKKGGSKNTKTDTGAAPAGGGTSAGPSVAPAKEQLAAASPEDRAAVEEAASGPVADAAGPDPIIAERAGTAPGSSASDLPVPVLVLLALLLAGALAIGAVRIRSLVDARRA